MYKQWTDTVNVLEDYLHWTVLGSRINESLPEDGEEVHIPVLMWTDK